MCSLGLVYTSPPALHPQTRAPVTETGEAHRTGQSQGPKAREGTQQEPQPVANTLRCLRKLTCTQSGWLAPISLFTFSQPTVSAISGGLTFPFSRQPLHLPRAPSRNLNGLFDVWVTWGHHCPGSLMGFTR